MFGAQHSWKFKLIPYLEFLENTDNILCSSLSFETHHWRNLHNLLYIVYHHHFLQILLLRSLHSCPEEATFRSWALLRVSLTCVTTSFPFVRQQSWILQGQRICLAKNLRQNLKEQRVIKGEACHCFTLWKKLMNGESSLHVEQCRKLRSSSCT